MKVFGRQEPQPYKLADERQLRCLVCDYQLFWYQEAQLNTAVATFFNLDWANRSAICLVCDQCGYIHWFLPYEP
ncbi:MAG TPA: hypothetical protein V6C90_10825 [Coleofasciculaceae cyanobacterium]|jgi:uncharacterized protein with PIN domain